MAEIDVVHVSNLKRADSTDGIMRFKAFDSENFVVSQSRVGAGVVSGWHHHGTRELYGFLVSGRLQLEYSLSGSHRVDVNSGDFFHIPVGLVHRDVNPDKDRELVVVNVLAGKGPTVVNLVGPTTGK